MKRHITALFLMMIVIGIFGQTSGGFTPTTNASAYIFEGTRGVSKLKMNTYIWGQVTRPGLYLVPDDTDLLMLISLAGGPREDAKLSDIRIVRPTAEREKIIIVNLKKYIQTGDEKLIPRLYPGDTVIVRGTIFYAFSRVTDFLSKAAIALSVYNTIVRIK